MDLTDAQSAAFDDILRGESVAYFLSGPGGCGKSTIISRLALALGDTRCIVTATTNQAAASVGSRAVTVHRALQLMKGEDRVSDQIQCKTANRGFCDPNLAAVYSAMQRSEKPVYLIVDEVSMIGAQALAGIMSRLMMLWCCAVKNRLHKHAFPFLDMESKKHQATQRSAIRGRWNGSNTTPYTRHATTTLRCPEELWIEAYKKMPSNDKARFPRIVFVGDPMQLEPVFGKDGAGESDFFWCSPWWTVLSPKRLILSQNMRASEDLDYASFLDKLRLGELDPVGARKIRVQPIVITGDSSNFAVAIVGRVKTAADINENRFNELKMDRPFCLARNHAIDTVTKKNAHISAYQSELAAALPDTVSLVVGAAVILIANIYTELGFVKGQRGTVRAIIESKDIFCNCMTEDQLAQMAQSVKGNINITVLDSADSIERLLPIPAGEPNVVFQKPEPTFPEVYERYLLVEFHDMLDSSGKPIMCIIGKHVHSCYELDWNAGTGRIEHQIVASRSQWPFLLGYAITAHRAQGLTLKSVQVDVGYGGGVFGNHAVYVALSRARTFESVSSTSRLTPDHILINKQALRLASADPTLPF